MAIRFRRSVKIVPGVRLNVSKTGPSLSIGGRGATVNFSKRGTRTTVGIPGTGLSVASSSRYSDRTRQHHVEPEEMGRQRAKALAHVKVSLDDDGVLTCLDGDGLPLRGRELSMMWSQHGPAINTLLCEAADKINGDVNLFNGIHLDAPDPSPVRLLVVEDFAEPKPRRPASTNKPPKPVIRLPETPGFISRLFGGRRRHEQKASRLQDEHAKAIDAWTARCSQIDVTNAQAITSWKDEHAAWEKRRDAFNCHGEQADAEHRAKLAADADYSAAVLEEAVNALEWPRETQISFQLDLNGKCVWLDVDLPEIEDLPQRVATVASSGKKLNVKTKPQKVLRLEYARHVHGIAMRIAATVAAVLPWADAINLSGFSQRLDKATGVMKDDYLYSVAFTRAGLVRIDFKSLEAVDPIEAIAAFEHRRKMTTAGVFTPIQPYSPD